MRSGRRPGFPRAPVAALLLSPALALPLALGAVLAGPPGGSGEAAADVILLAGGEETIEGRIASETDVAVTIEVEGGFVTIERKRISSIERKPWTPGATWLGTASEPEPRPSPGTGTATPGSALTPWPTPAPGAGPSGVVRVVIGWIRADVADARERPGAGETIDWAARLVELGPTAVPDLAEALAIEADPEVAAVLERAVNAYPTTVSGSPFVAALARRGLEADPWLFRLAGEYGGPKGAEVLVSLLREVGRARAALEAEAVAAAAGGAPDRARARALDEVEATILDGVGRAGGLDGLTLLVSLLERSIVDGSFALPATDGLREALALGFERALGGTETREGAAEMARAALERWDGPPLTFLLTALRDVRLDGTVPTLRRILDRTVALPERTPERIALREAAIDVLRPLAVDGERAPEPGALELLGSLLADTRLATGTRLAIVADLGSSRNIGAVPALIDAYEEDPSPLVRRQAHGALVRLARGENHGDAPAWRAWWEGERRRP